MSILTGMETVLEKVIIRDGADANTGHGTEDGDGDCSRDRAKDEKTVSKEKQETRLTTALPNVLEAALKVALKQDSLASGHLASSSEFLPPLSKFFLLSKLPLPPSEFPPLVFSSALEVSSSTFLSCPFAPQVS